ncbi:bifunctional methyltransferase/pyrophosphohydrolase YabN [Cytobacillus horneckiae]|uniref:Nucleoside triphosphate pyrophosphohydrolase n=1 Tax=Cytobacillus horneckiae TaxID=549687 RepID=A0A2N0ZDE6_9BACI|nr:nucleoside triphosphate pyrophosphohydrolase [Cytobacillus horneckiae]MEC1154586.1 nucleoside triphosphate pyrophosphohydrolase [Cytobacillus horneckiae]MED2939365.1 nucleoside triphosphate pyrophosphohydrolase [Cytobacillus horneckiae]PKG27538.1 nucleoside triphosphate pyrophosphohydrolase [Cytobacillus horneckiae]
MKISIIGLGAGDFEQLPMGVYKQLKSSDHLYLRTKEHPVIAELESEGLAYQSFDHIYEAHDQFDAVYEEICSFLLQEASKYNLVYAVPGHPLVAEKTVQLLIERAEEAGIELEINGGQSFLDSMFQALKIDPVEGFQLLDGTSLNKDELSLKQHMIIGQVYDSFVASEVKLSLMDLLPFDYKVWIVTAAGSKEEELREVPLFELDHHMRLNNLTSVYVPPVSDEALLNKSFNKLREIIAVLRGPNGCPWDKKQTHESLKKYLIEEAYELIEAIDEDDIDHIIEELGDVLLQVLLHAQIGEDEGFFSIEDIIQGLSEKMIRRHPHVFGGVEAENVDEVLQNWQSIKAEEKGEKPASLLDGIPASYPQLLKAEALQKKAAKVGFDWEEVSSIWDKVREEIKEFEIETENNNENMISEFGDILFAFVNIARYYQINPEEALNRTNNKFYHRFLYIEEKVRESGKDISSFSVDQLDAFWNEAKKRGY